MVFCYVTTSSLSNIIINMNMNTVYLELALKFVLCLSCALLISFFPQNRMIRKLDCLE